MNTEEFEGFAPVYPALFNDWNAFIRKYWTLTLWPVKPCSPGLPGSPLAPCQEIKQEDEPLSDDRQPVPRVIESNKALFMPALKKTTEVQFEDGETSFARSYVLANREIYFFSFSTSASIEELPKVQFYFTPKWRSENCSVWFLTGWFGSNTNACRIMMTL